MRKESSTQRFSFNQNETKKSSNMEWDFLFVLISPILLYIWRVNCFFCDRRPKKVGHDATNSKKNRNTGTLRRFVLNVSFHFVALKSDPFWYCTFIEGFFKSISYTQQFKCVFQLPNYCQIRTDTLIFTRQFFFL